MAERKNEEEALDSYIRRIEDQELKGILLKLKNEIRKPDASWVVIKTILRSLLDKDREVFLEVLPLILK